MEESKISTASRLSRFEAFSDKFLRFAELWTIIVLVTSIWIVALGTAFWITLHPTDRLVTVIKTINENWKAGLLLLAPVFYRTIRILLERMKKFPFGMEVQEPEEQQTAPTKKRSPTVDSGEEG